MSALNKRIDELEDSPLIGRREFFDALEPLADAGLLGGDLFLYRLHAEKLVDGDVGRLGETDEEGRLPVDLTRARLAARMYESWLSGENPPPGHIGEIRVKTARGEQLRGKAA